MNNRLINILIDFAFKQVFAGNGESSEFILKHFLNCILELNDDDKIKEIVQLNPFNEREYIKDKQSIMDIKIKTEKDEYIDIEVQINDVDNYKKRSLYYWSKLYGESLGKGDSYYELKKSIVINIVNFNIIEENDKYHNVFVIKEREENTLFLEDLEIHYIELEKFNVEKDINELNDLEEWIVFLKECNEKHDCEIIEKLSSRKEEIEMAVKIMNKLSADEIEYQKYLAREKYIMDEISKKKYAQYKMAQMKEQEEKSKKAEEEAKKALAEAEEKTLQAEEKRKVAEEKRKAEEEKRKVEEVKRKAEEAKRIAAEKKALQAEEELDNMKKTVALNLLDLLDDHTIAIQTGLSIEEVGQIRKGHKSQG